jgi:predicted dienelactone hydrolase
VTYLCSIWICLAAILLIAPAQAADTYKVGIRQIEFADTHYGDRTLAVAIFYPATVDGESQQFKLPFFTNLELYEDAVLAPSDRKRPLVMLSHGRGSNRVQYAWFAQVRAAHGYFVAARYHYRVNTYDATIAAVPQYLRDELPLDPTPALHDSHIKCAVAMAPGMIKAFGMDAAGLAEVKVPVYITVGAHDTQTPPADNAKFAAKHIPGAQLAIIPGDVDHEIFVNKCDQEGRNEFPEACIDAPGVDRHAIHKRGLGCGSPQRFTLAHRWSLTARG